MGIKDITKSPRSACHMFLNPDPIRLSHSVTGRDIACTKQVIFVRILLHIVKRRRRPQQR